MFLKPFLAASLIGCAVLVMPTLSMAQDTTQDPVQDTAGINADTISDDKINAFVKAAVALEQLRKAYTERIMEAKTEEERAAMIADADTVARQVVNRMNGITADEYQAIAQLLVKDEALNARIGEEVARMKELQAEKAPQGSDGRLRYALPTPKPAPQTAPQPDPVTE